MAWTENLDIGEFLAGSYLLGKGAAGSEYDVGEIVNCKGTISYTYVDVMGGASLGSQTRVDAVCVGINAELTFGILQHIGNDTKDVVNLVAPNAALSAGATKKTMTLDANTICGISAIQGGDTERWVLHYKGTSSLTDLTDDIVFPRALVHLTDEEIDFAGEDGAIIIPCRLIAFPDTNNDVVVIGTNAT
jgi:hypothetical protein